MAERETAATDEALPLVVQLGFAGARRLLDTTTHPNVDPADFEAAVQTQFEAILQRELANLNLGPQLFLCGISSIAIGGDTVFTRACRAQKIVQRVFLPLPRENFLNDSGSAGPDFSAAQQVVARDLLASPHVIQERVVSGADDRRERFHEVNLEIVRISDLLVCLVRAEQTIEKGGTREVIDLAAKRHRPVLEIQVGVGDDGQPKLTPMWHGLDQLQKPKLPHAIAHSALPKEIGNSSVLDVRHYVEGLKTASSHEANSGKKRFAKAAYCIIGAHVLATILAVLALKLHGPAIVGLLVVELVSLAIGFGVHYYFHRTHQLEHWANARLIAEVARSMKAIGSFHVYLEHLFTLPFPPALRAVLRTTNVLHLSSTRHVTTPWEAQRGTYVLERLVSPKVKAQIPYNEGVFVEAEQRLTWARRTFYVASIAAFLATVVKLIALLGGLPVEQETADTIAAITGVFAVVLPVIAVAALSLVAAFDFEARHTFSKQMLEFLREQKTLLENASSAREYSRLLIETESRLLGETVNWHARRSFLSAT